MKNQEENQNILNDVSAGGKKREWAMKKKNNEYLQAIYMAIDEEAKAKRLSECASFLIYNKLNEQIKLKTANFCRVRLCPICSWRRSLKLFSQLDLIFKHISQQKTKYKYIYITLTVRNVYPCELKDSIDKMMKAWNLFKEYADVKRVLRGSVRTFEVTHNLVDNTYHPHFHVLAFVPSSYFKQVGNYLTQKEWQGLWAKAMKIDYEPIVDVRRVKNKDNFSNALDLTAAILETAKYSVKDSDYLVDDFDLACETVALLDKVLANRRFVAFTGVVKDVHKLLNLTDVDEEHGDLIHTDEDSDEPTVEVPQEEIVYIWNSGLSNYFRE